MQISGMELGMCVKRSCQDRVMWNEKNSLANIKMSLEFIVLTSAYRFSTKKKSYFKKRDTANNYGNAFEVQLKSHSHNPKVKY